MTRGSSSRGRRLTHRTSQRESDDATTTERLLGTGETTATAHSRRRNAPYGLERACGWTRRPTAAPARSGRGFNIDRALAGGDDSSVKDGFFRWTYGCRSIPAGQEQGRDRQFLRDNVHNAREYGLNILDVNGEQILIETDESGPEWVDVVASAGSAILAM